MSTKAYKRVKRIVVKQLPSNPSKYYAEWTYTGNKKYPIESFSLRWNYTIDGIRFKDSSDSTVSASNNRVEYSPGENVTKIRVTIKPVPKQVKRGKKTVPSFKDAKSKTSAWLSLSPQYVVPAPGTPSLEIKEKTKLTLTSTADGSKLSKVQFHIVRDNDPNWSYDTTVNVVNGQAVATINVALGHGYRAMAYGVSKYGKSSGTEYSSVTYSAPSTPVQPDIKTALDESNVYLYWAYTLTDDTTFTIEYTTDARYFDTGGNVQSVTTKLNSANISISETGKTYWFRIKAIQNGVESSWGPTFSIVIGKKPEPPTIWSSATTYEAGESIPVYWTHNASDSSSLTTSVVEWSIESDDNTLKGSETLKNTRDKDHNDDIYEYDLMDSSQINDYINNHKSGSSSVNILWRVKTKGILNQYSEWSESKNVTVYTKPVADVDSSLFTTSDRVFPITFIVVSDTYDSVQKPITSHLEISISEIDPDQNYVDTTGVRRGYTEGETLYNKLINMTYRSVSFRVEPGDIPVLPGATYKFNIVVAYDSGLTVEWNHSTELPIDEIEIEPDASLDFDYDTYTMHIQPFCETDDNKLIPGIMLDVYRIDFDGGLTLIDKDLENSYENTIIDPHPALTSPTYRIVSHDAKSGSIAFYDISDDTVEVSNIIIQWDESIENYKRPEGVYDDLADEPVSQSMVILPYNIDISDESNVDSVMVNYIGRKHPVSYYGTQVGQTSNWSAEIPVTDTETIYMLRRLQVWTGDVYVREPSGVGYWGSIKVSMPIKHTALTIPVTLKVTRVEGGK